jgi:hypothetical protein
MQIVGLSLIGVAILLFGISVIGASTDHRGEQFKLLQWLVEQLRTPINNLTKQGLKWYRRVNALGEICLLVGLFLVVLGLI